MNLSVTPCNLCVLSSMLKRSAGNHYISKTTSKTYAPKHVYQNTVYFILHANCYQVSNPCQFELLSSQHQIIPNFQLHVKKHIKIYFMLSISEDRPVRRRCRPGSQSEKGSGCPGWPLSVSSRCSGCEGRLTTRWSYHWWTRSLDTWKGQKGKIQMKSG